MKQATSAALLCRRAEQCLCLAVGECAGDAPTRHMLVTHAIQYLYAALSAYCQRGDDAEFNMEDSFECQRVKFRLAEVLHCFLEPSDAIINECLALLDACTYNASTSPTEDDQKLLSNNARWLSLAIMLQWPPTRAKGRRLLSAVVKDSMLSESAVTALQWLCYTNLAGTSATLDQIPPQLATLSTIIQAHTWLIVDANGKETDAGTKHLQQLIAAMPSDDQRNYDSLQKFIALYGTIVTAMTALHCGRVVEARAALAQVHCMMETDEFVAETWPNQSTPQKAHTWPLSDIPDSVRIGWITSTQCTAIVYTLSGLCAQVADTSLSPARKFLLDGIKFIEQSTGEHGADAVLSRVQLKLLELLLPVLLTRSEFDDARLVLDRLLESTPNEDNGTWAKMVPLLSYYAGMVCQGQGQLNEADEWLEATGSRSLNSKSEHCQILYTLCVMQRLLLGLASSYPEKFAKTISAFRKLSLAELNDTSVTLWSLYVRVLQHICDAAMHLQRSEYHAAKVTLLSALQLLSPGTNQTDDYSAAASVPHCPSAQLKLLVLTMLAQLYRHTSDAEAQQIATAANSMARKMRQRTLQHFTEQLTTIQ